MTKPGFYKDVDFDEYVALDAVNSSILNGFKRTPAHVLYDMQHGGKARTSSLDLGWLLHLAVLEPERYAAEIRVPPKVDKRTKKGKELYAEFEAANEGARLVDAPTVAKVSAMKDAILTHETAGEFFTGDGINECSILWEEPEHGVRCKARVDRVAHLAEWPIVGDLKSARDASRRGFEKSIQAYGYHVQAVHYLKGLEALAPIPVGNPFRRFVFFVVESEPPHCVAAYELDDAALQEGAIQRERYLKTWRECVESQVWPGYAPGVDYCSLPPWAFKNYVQD